jgi:hypothetical protein
MLLIYKQEYHTLLENLMHYFTCTVNNLKKNQLGTPMLLIGCTVKKFKTVICQKDKKMPAELKTQLKKG